MASAIPITPHLEAIKGPRQALYPPSSGSFMASATPFTPSARPKKASTMPFTPFVEATKGLDLAAIGALAAIYPAVWGLAQLVTGGLSDRIGRKGLIVAGMWVQAVGIGTWPTRRGGRRPSGCTGCGQTSATRSERWSPGSWRTHSGWTRRYGWSQPQHLPRA